MKRLKTNRVIWHHSLSGDVSASVIRDWHLKRGFSDIGYHYVVRSYGEVEKGRNFTDVGAHAKGKNTDSIGVCITGNFMTGYPSFEQMGACKKLYHQLCRTFGKRLKNEFHRTWLNPCPGRFLKRAWFLSELDKA